MAQDGRRQIDDVRRCRTRRAAGETGPFDHQHRRILVTRQPAMLAAPDTHRLVPTRHRCQSVAGHAVFVRRIVRPQRHRECQRVMRRLPEGRSVETFGVVS